MATPIRILGPNGLPLSSSNRLPVGVEGIYAEDAAHASGDKGMLMLGVRNDLMAGLAGADLDYVPFATDSKGLPIQKQRLEQWFEQGKLRVVGGSQTLSVAGTGSFRLANPLGSGKNLLVVFVALASTVAGDATFNKNGTLTSPTALTPWNPNFGAADTTVATAQRSGSAVSGGTALAASVRVPLDVTRPVSTAALLIPDTAISYSIALATGGTIHCNLVYVEDP